MLGSLMGLMWGCRCWMARLRLTFLAVKVGCQWWASMSAASLLFCAGALSGLRIEML